MNLFKYIHWPVFFVSFLLGLFLIYFYVPSSRHIYVYPTPENDEFLQYKDLAGNCFSFVREKVDCPSDKRLIQQVPFQMGET